ncbi:MAG: hypothetical protein MEQ74_13895, partial [Paracoccus sp.]|nr:hypothetical protein [Paracoccus sp. (in: a-proteobacteria)]
MRLPDMLPWLGCWKRSGRVRTGITNYDRASACASCRTAISWGKWMEDGMTLSPLYRTRILLSLGGIFLALP